MCGHKYVLLHIVFFTTFFHTREKIIIIIIGVIPTVLLCTYLGMYYKLVFLKSMNEVLFSSSLSQT